MNQLIAVFVPLVLVPAFGCAEPVVVASWNLQNYLLQNRYEHGSFRFSYPKPENQKTGMRQALLECRPDILFLQEIGSEAFLLELQKDLAASGLEYPFSHCAQAPDTRSGLAVLSRAPLDSVMFHHPVPIAHKEYMDYMRRGLQEVSFSIAGQQFRFFHLHLKSRFTSDPSDPQSLQFRTAEINALAKFIRPWLAHDRDSRHLFLVGDFNTPFSSSLLDALREFWRPVPASDPDGQSWTYTYHKTGTRERIDGFWRPCSLSPAGISASIHSQALPPSSDHRLLILEIQSTDFPSTRP